MAQIIPYCLYQKNTDICMYVHTHTRTQMLTTAVFCWLMVENLQMTIIRGKLNTFKCFYQAILCGHLKEQSSFILVYTKNVEYRLNIPYPNACDQKYFRFQILSDSGTSAHT